MLSQKFSNRFVLSLSFSSSPPLCLCLCLSSSLPSSFLSFLRLRTGSFRLTAYSTLSFFFAHCINTRSFILRRRTTFCIFQTVAWLCTFLYFICDWCWSECVGNLQFLNTHKHVDGWRVRIQTHTYSNTIIHVEKALTNILTEWSGLRRILVPSVYTKSV